MIVQELEIPLSQVTLQDCMDMYFFRSKSATINDGELKGFEKEPYVQEILSREEQAERYAKLNRILDMAIEGAEKVLEVLEEDFDKGCEMLRDLIDRLEDER